MFRQGGWKSDQSSMFRVGLGRTGLLWVYVTVVGFNSNFPTGSQAQFARMCISAMQHQTEKHFIFLRFLSLKKRSIGNFSLDYILVSDLVH